MCQSSFLTFLQLPAVREDVAPGTSVASVAASDLDSGSNREITYSIAPESDPYHLFSVDQSGLVTVASELDREKSRTASLGYSCDRSRHVTVDWQPQLSRWALLDVNDNGPEFEAAYAPIVWENVLGPQVVRLNQSSTLLRAMDQDSEKNGSPFSFSVPLEYRYTAMISTCRIMGMTRPPSPHWEPSTERGRRSFYYYLLLWPIAAVHRRPSQTHSLSDHRDENDHAHIAGQKNVFINCHRGNGFNIISMY